MQLKLGGAFGYWLLKRLSKRPTPGGADVPHGPAGAEKLERLLGRGVLDRFVDKTVFDFGCGEGKEAVAVAVAGARCVVGADVLNDRLAAARRHAEEARVADRCLFLHAIDDADEITRLAGTFDSAFSLDAFEHFDDPGAVLKEFRRLLVPGGELLVSFGPPWKHPYGSHMRYFIRWPWAHLVFDEPTLLRVRALHRDDGARRFGEVDGGLNQMTLARFKRLVSESGFAMRSFRAVPLSTRFVERTPTPLKLLTLPGVREYFTSVVLCELVKPEDDAQPSDDATALDAVDRQPAVAGASC